MNFHFFKIVGFIFTLFSLKTLQAQALITLPFGQRWGDSPEKLIQWAALHSLDTIINLPSDQPAIRIIKVVTRKGFLPNTQANAVEGFFLHGKLYELTVHYVDPEASADMMETRYVALRKQITSEFGVLQTNQQKKTVKDQFATQTQSFHLEPVKGLFLLLNITEIEDLLRHSRIMQYSLIYRNENLKNEITHKNKSS